MLHGAMNVLSKASTDEVLVRRSGGLGRLTLNRPAVLNAPTPGMVARMVAAIMAWEEDDDISGILIDGAGERGLCAGGDVRMLHASGRRRDGLAQRFWHDGYVLDALIARSVRPIIGVMSGIVIGAGLGLTGHAPHRIATESLLLSIPEVRIGLLPDVGATWLLSRAPSEIGTYLGLTGTSVGAADAVAALGREPDAWAGEVLALLRTRSLTSLKISLAALRAARGLNSLEDCLRLEFRLVCRILDGHDFYEGVRSAVIDKDRNPRWKPGRIEDVADGTVRAYLDPQHSPEVLFAPTRRVAAG